MDLLETSLLAEREVSEGDNFNSAYPKSQLQPCGAAGNENMKDLCTQKALHEEQMNFEEGGKTP